ncbi:MAG TPA: hypothetical protein VIW68_00425 [Candidatus Sulfotelmatobacter sp.]
MNILNRKQGEEAKARLDAANEAQMAAAERPRMMPTRSPVLLGIRERLVELATRRQQVEQEIAALQFECARFENDPTLEETIQRLQPILEVLRDRYALLPK